MTADTGASPLETAVVHEIVQSHARALRRLTWTGALVSAGMAFCGLTAHALGQVALRGAFLGLSGVLSVCFVWWRLLPAGDRMWMAAGPPLPPVRRALHGSDALAFDADLYRALFHEPPRTVWAYAKRRGLIPFVAVGLSSGVRYAVALDASGCDRVLGILAQIAPRAEIGFSEEREGLYLRHPGEPPKLDARVQIVGAVCPGCGTKMVSELDALVCDQCGCPVHDACLTLHTQQTHAAAPGAAYR